MSKWLLIHHYDFDLWLLWWWHFCTTSRLGLCHCTCQVYKLLMLKTNAYSTMKPVSAPHCFHNAYSQSREHYATHWSAILWITFSGVLMYLLNWNLCKFRIALLFIFMVCKPLFVHCTGLLTGLNTTVNKVIAYWGGEDIHIKIPCSQVHKQRLNKSDCQSGKFQ